MSSYQSPNDQVSVLQLNSELEHAHFELVSARCAVHQLRLRYSCDDLARFGRQDVLRKSADAANALRDFYAAIENRIPCAPPAPSAPEVSTDQIAQAVGWISGYLQDERNYYSPVAIPLATDHKARMWPCFSTALLDRIRIVELHGARVRVPDFVAKVRALGFDPPEIAHMDSITFVDIVAFNQRLSERALVHALVHAVQIDLLGLDRYSDLWVRGFLKTRAHFTVPLEIHAFSLSSRFLRSTLDQF